MANQQESPYLSVVAVSRNDDHGGNLLFRMQLFIDGLADHCRRHGLDAELVLVEWNPPPDRDRLAKALRWPEKGARSPRVRIVTAPEHVHHRFAMTAPLPLFQMIGKNAGIRRARGEFVLSTNIDILFSDGLMAWIAGRPLAVGRSYRLDRHDVPDAVPIGLPARDRLVWCAEHVFRIHKRDSLLVRAPDAPAPEERYFRREALPLPGRAVRFIRAAGEAGGGSPAAYARAVLRAGAKGLRWLGIDRPRAHPHTNACGDFTLLARSDWERLGGYPEWPMYSWHLDGLLLYLAAARGIEEEEQAPERRIFHIEHGSGWTASRHDELFNELRAAGVPFLTDADLDRHIEMLNQVGPGFTFNGTNWGLADDPLDELELN